MSTHNICFQGEISKLSICFQNIQDINMFSKIQDGRHGRHKKVINMFSKHMKKKESYQYVFKTYEIRKLSICFG